MQITQFRGNDCLGPPAYCRAIGHTAGCADPHIVTV